MRTFFDAQRKLRGSFGSWRRLSLNFEAQVNAWGASYRNGRRTGQVGQILLWLGGFGAGILSHEMTHAALYWVMRRRRSIRKTDKRADELLAWTQGWLVTQFWRNFYRLGLDKIDPAHPARRIRTSA